MTINDFSNKRYVQAYLQANPEHKDLVDLASYIISTKKSYASFKEGAGQVLRQSYDEVIDMPRTRRWSLAQLEKTEKTYVGTKVEILTRHWLDVDRGAKLDLLIDGHEVDVKNTVGTSWMIPTEAVGEICLLIQGNDIKGLYSIGLIRTNENYLTKGGNKDGKRSINKEAKAKKILWLIHTAGLPENFFFSMDPTIRNSVLMQKSGAARVRQMFLELPLTVIPRSAIEGAANQKDALKRVRKNGGARDKLLAKGLLILSGKYDGELVSDLGLPVLTNDDFISVPRGYIKNHLGDRAAKELFNII